MLRRNPIPRGTWHRKAKTGSSMRRLTYYPLINGEGSGLQLRTGVRVDEDIAALAPHRPGRARFGHPVLRSTGSLTNRHSDGLTTPSVTRLARNPCCSPAWLSAPDSLTHFWDSRPPPCFSRTTLYNGAPLPSTGSARAAFPGVISTIRALRLPVPNTGSLIVLLSRPSACPQVRSLAAETSAGPGPVQARYH